MARAQATTGVTVRVRLADETSGEPVAGAEVSIVRGLRRAVAMALTDDAGLRVLTVPADSGEYQVVVRKIGYRRADRFFPAMAGRDTLSVLFSMIFFSDLTVLPLTVTIGAGYPAVVYGLLVGLNGLLIALFEISVVVSLRGRRRLRVAALGAALCGFGYGLTGLLLHWSWFLLAILLSTAGEILTSPQQMAFVADWAPPRARGRYLALYQATWSLSLALNPVLLLPLHARLGEALFWMATGSLALPSVLVLLHLDRVADRPARLRGLSETAPDPALLSAVTPEA